MARFDGDDLAGEGEIGGDREVLRGTIVGGNTEIFERFRGGEHRRAIVEVHARVRGRDGKAVGSAERGFEKLTVHHFVVFDVLQ